MAIYNNGFPMGYPQYYNPYQQQQFNQMQQAQQSMNNNGNGIKWVQGEAGVKSAYVKPGESDLFMDSEENCFYIKSVDASGMPLPLRIFDYKERTAQQPLPQVAQPEQPQIDLSAYVTRDEIMQIIQNELNNRIPVSQPVEDAPKKTAKKG